MKRICVYCQTWESGGIEAFINNALTHMDLSGIEVDIAVDVLKKSIFTDGLKARGITFYELSGSQRNFMRNYRLFAKLIDERKYDVLHLNIFQALPIAYLRLAKRKGITIRIAHSHNTMLRQSRTWMLKTGIHKAASYLFSKYATDLWACSYDAAKFMFPAALLEKKTYRFIPNGIDLHRFRFNAIGRERIRKQLHLEGAFVIGHIGRLCKQKNQSFLVDVFAQIRAEDTSARLLLIGEGEMLAELQEKVSRLSLDNAVIFFGTTSHVERLLWAMDAFVFPSLFEGFGIVAIEAQAAGLPTICSDKVPREALASSLVCRIPLDAHISLWQAAVLNARDKQRCPDDPGWLSLCGFDINMVSESILETYRRPNGCAH